MRTILFTSNSPAEGLPEITAGIVLYDEGDGAIVRHAHEAGQYDNAYLVEGAGDNLRPLFKDDGEPWDVNCAINAARL